MPTPLLRLALAAVLLLATVVPASASHLIGIKVVATDVDPATRSVDVDFTLYDNDAAPTNAEATSPANLFWGDGESDTSITATFVSAGPNTYRGSMSHTYEEGDVEGAGGDFTIRVQQCCTPPGLTSEELVTGRLNEYPRGGGDVTNTTMISFDSVLAVPTTNGVGLLLLSALLGVGGLVLLRR